MAAETSAVFAVYKKRRRAESAKKLLIDAGFLEEQICLFWPPGEDAKYLHENVRTSWRMGAFVGAAVGAVAFLIVGIFLILNIINLPAHFEKSLPLATQIVLTCVIVLLGAVVGAVAGTLVGFGTPEPAAPRFASYVQSGGTVLSVGVASREDSAKARIIFDRTGGHDITKMVEKDSWKMIHDQLYERRKNNEPKLLDNQNV